MNKRKPFFFNKKTTNVRAYVEDADHGVITYKWGGTYITKCTSGVWITFNIPREGDIRLERILGKYTHDPQGDSPQEKMLKLLATGTSK